MKYTLLLSGLCLGTVLQANAQSTPVDIQDGTAQYLNRIEALSGSFSDELHSTVQPLQRRDVANFLKEAQRLNLKNGWSNTDNGLMSRYMASNGEWMTEDHDGAVRSRMPVWNTFYKTTTDFIYHNDRNLFLSVNPVLGYQGLYERSEEGNAYRQSITAGAQLRANYPKIIGGTFNLRYVSEEPVSYYQLYNDRKNTLIGIHQFKQPKPGQYQYWLPTRQISCSGWPRCRGFPARRCASSIPSWSPCSAGASGRHSRPGRCWRRRWALGSPCRIRKRRTGSCSGSRSYAGSAAATSHRRCRTSASSSRVRRRATRWP